MFNFIKRTTLTIIAVQLNLVSLQANTLSCSELLSSDQGIVLPRELNASPQVLTRIAENGHRELLDSLALLFVKYQDPQLLNKLSYSFRRYNINQSSAAASSEQTNSGFLNRVRGGVQRMLGEQRATEAAYPFEELWRGLPDALTRGVDSDDIKPMFFAIKSNLEGGSLTDEEVLITAILMKRGRLDFKYKTNERQDVYNREDRDQVTELDKEVAHVFAQNPYIRKWNSIISDGGFKLFLKAILDTSSFSENPIHPGVIALLEKTFKKSFQFKAGNKYSQSIIGIILTVTEDYIYDYSISGRRGEEARRVARIAFLNNLEEALITFLDDGSQARSFINFLDFFIFRTPFPIEPSKIFASFIEGSKSALLPLKGEASAQLADEAQERRQLETERVRPLVSLATTQVRTPEPNTQRRNPRKRRNRSCPRGNPVVEPEVRVVEASPANLCPETNITADEPYRFFLLRNPEMPLQTITFSSEIVSEFNTQNAVNWPEFIRPLLYGFTSENGQNGIKKLGANMNLKDIYEIKPGVSSYRVILRRQGNSWRTIAFLHKDQIDRFINSL